MTTLTLDRPDMTIPVLPPQPDPAGRATLSNDDVIAAHLEWLHQIGLRPATIVKRRSELRRLAADLGVPLLDATPAMLTARQARLARTVSVGSVRTYTAHDKAFYRWAHDQAELLADNPARKLQAPKRGKVLPRPIGERDLQRALKAAAATSAVLYVWLLLAAYCGLRAGEIALMSRADVTEHEDGSGSLLVHGKGGHERTVPVAPEVLDALRPYLARRGAIFRRPLSGRPIEQRDVTRASTALFRELGMAVTIHCCRHRYASRLLVLGTDVRTIQALLGHQSLTSTMIYLEVIGVRAVGKVRQLARELRSGRVGGPRSRSPRTPRSPAGPDRPQIGGPGRKTRTTVPKPRRAS